MRCVAFVLITFLLLSLSPTLVAAQTVQRASDSASLPASAEVQAVLGVSDPAVLAASDSATQGEVEGAATMGVAHMVLTKDKDVKDGSILSASPKGAILSVTAYDAQVVGVVARDAAIVISNQGFDNSAPVISIGTVYVLVSSKDGVIKQGDQIATSTIPGVGTKATKSGYVLGTALEDYTEKDPKKTGKIAVDLDMHYFNSKPSLPGSLSDVLKVALLPTKESPSPIFKYVVAAAVVLGSFVLGFLSFGRTAAKGVEALGRNPAAGRIIHLGIIFNVVIVVMIIAAGMGVSFLILRL